MNAATYWQRWWAAKTPPKRSRTRRKNVSPGAVVESVPAVLGSPTVVLAPAVPVAHIHIDDAAIEAALYAPRPAGVPLGIWLDMLATEA